jgi:hypothetical protein
MARRRLAHEHLLAAILLVSDLGKRRVAQRIASVVCKQALYQARLTRPLALPRQPDSPIASSATGWWHTLACGHGIASVR